VSLTDVAPLLLIASWLLDYIIWAGWCPQCRRASDSERVNWVTTEQDGHGREIEILKRGAGSALETIRFSVRGLTDGRSTRPALISPRSNYNYRVVIMIVISLPLPLGLTRTVFSRGRLPTTHCARIKDCRTQTPPLARSSSTAHVRRCTDPDEQVRRSSLEISGRDSRYPLHAARYLHHRPQQALLRPCNTRIRDRSPAARRR